MAQNLPERDRRSAGKGIFRQQLRIDGGVEVEPSRLDHLHDGHGIEELRDRTRAEHRVLAASPKPAS